MALFSRRERSRSSLDSDSELDQLGLPGAGAVLPQAPAPGNGIVVQSAPQYAAGMQVLNLTPGSIGSNGGDHESRVQILDRIANRGMSEWEIKQKLATDVYMTDEQRTAYLSAIERGGPQLPPANLAQPTALAGLRSLDSDSTGPTFPQKGTIYNQAASPMLSDPMSKDPAQSVFPEGTLFAQGASSPVAANPKIDPSGQFIRGIDENFHPFAQNTGHVFEPVSNGGGWFTQAFWRRSASPFELLIGKIIDEVLKLFGIGRPQGPVPPHLRGGGGMV